MIRIDEKITAQDLAGAVKNLFAAAREKILGIDKTWDSSRGSPVFTQAGQYTSQGWTEWTQGFQFGSAILQFEATGEKSFLELGRNRTHQYMASHLTHIGVHDHGFNNVSTYGNLLRLMNSGVIEEHQWERRYYELALKVTGAVQAARWTALGPNSGYIYSFNGPHSLFSDTVRSLRALTVSHQLGHLLMAERDRKINLFHRTLAHAESTSRYNVYFGTGRDSYDIRGRVVHESIFNLNDGSYRCPSTQQGYSPFSTWTRGLAWILCGYAEQLEYLAGVPELEFPEYMSKAKALELFTNTASAVADFFIEQSPTDGIPYWDTGAPGLSKLGDYNDRPSDPFNEHEPVDSSAAVISAQGLIRFGNSLNARGKNAGDRYLKAGFTVARSVFAEPYLSSDPSHQGLIHHAVYHRPNGWDYIPKGKKVPSGESCMWGDYHAMELGVLIQSLIEKRAYHKFFLDKP